MVLAALPYRYKADDVIHGDADAGVPLELTSKRVHDAVAGSELVVIEGAPHGLVVTHADEFNRALLDFLG